MFIRHPHDRTLERYQSHRLSSLEAEKVDLHISECILCTRKLEAWEKLHRGLDNLMPEELSDGFTERVLLSLPQQESLHPTFTPLSAEEPQHHRVRLFRPVLANALVATAATYLFISTGIMKTVFTLDADAVEVGFYVKITVVMDWVVRLASSISS